jgi:hypothetical protein
MAFVVVGSLNVLTIASGSFGAIEDDVVGGQMA